MKVVIKNRKKIFKTEVIAENGKKILCGCIKTQRGKRYKLLVSDLELF